ncbi:MAG TPA: hypothetical protein VIO36_03450 [Anaerolineaceae bacterium]
MVSVILHIQNEDPIVGEMDSLPSPSDSIILVKNPRRRDGKDISYINASVSSVIWPISRVSFIEIMSSGDEEEIITHVRE